MSVLPIVGRKPADDEVFFYHTDFTARVREIKADFQVYLRQRGEQYNWVVIDKDPQAAQYLVMTVQEPDGRYRPFDGRTLEQLRKLYQRGPDVDKIVAELEEKERAKQRADEQRDQQIADGIGQDLKYAGHVVTPTVAWRERGVKNGHSAAEHAHHERPNGDSGADQPDPA
jgi:hypothetical protein